MGATFLEHHRRKRRAIGALRNVDLLSTLAGGYKSCDAGASDVSLARLWRTGSARLIELALSLQTLHGENMSTRLSPLIIVAILASLPIVSRAAENPAAPLESASPGHVTGIGGVFVKSRNPKALAAWYRDVLGMPLETWGGALLRYDAPHHPSVAVWNAFPQSTDYMAPSDREFMVNFAVDDLDAIIARIESKGVHVLKRDDSAPNGRFAWLLDPDGTKVELWQPK